MHEYEEPCMLGGFHPVQPCSSGTPHLQISRTQLERVYQYIPGHECDRRFLELYKWFLAPTMNVNVLPSGAGKMKNMFLHCLFTSFSVQLIQHRSPTTPVRQTLLTHVR